MENMDIDFNINNNEKYVFDKEFFIERELEEVDGGVLHEDGFYVTPEGSFWDPDGDYFNKYGFDKYGGIYDQYKVYIPGEGWLEDYQCYKEDLQEHDVNEINEILNDRFEESCMNAQEVLNMIEYEDGFKDNENTDYNSAIKSRGQNNSLMNSNVQHNSMNKMDIDYKDSQKSNYQNFKNSNPNPFKSK